MKFALGQAVPRTEDPRLLTGRTRYTDDFVLPGLTHACSARRMRMPASARSTSAQHSRCRAYRQH